MFKIKPLKQTFTLLLVLVILVAILTKYKKSQTPPIEIKQTQKISNLTLTSILAPTLALPDNYAFRQDDPKWGTHTLGKTKDSLSEYGCTLTSVAIAASNLLKTEISPAEMNTRLTDVEGYTKNGLLIWRHVGTATNGKLHATMSTAPSHETINRCMESGGYPIIKIDRDQRINHWVVIVGKSEGDYFIRDPRIGNASDAPLPLSERSSYIYATRCVMTNNN